MLAVRRRAPRCSRCSRWRCATSRTPTIRNRGTTVGLDRARRRRGRDAGGAAPARRLASTWPVRPAAARSPAADLFVGPLESTLRHDEIAVDGVLPGAAPRARASAFEEIARRHGDYALCGVAALVTVDDGAVATRAATSRSCDVPTVVDLTGVAGRRRCGDAALAHLDPGDDIHATADYRAAAGRGCSPRGCVAAATRRTDRRRGQRMSEELHDVRLHGERRRRTTSRVPARRLLSDALRHDLGLTGTHVGCEHGVCGACTVLVDGQPMRSCLMFAVSAVDAEITTVEGLDRDADGVARPGAAGVRGVPRAAVRLLHAGLPHHDHRRAATRTPTRPRTRPAR